MRGVAGQALTENGSYGSVVETVKASTNMLLNSKELIGSLNFHLKVNFCTCNGQQGCISLKRMSGVGCEERGEL